MRWARISAVCLIGSLVACGGDDGGDAAALCERSTINGLEDQLTDDGIDFAELSDSLEVVRAAADGDLDRETEALLEVSEQFQDALDDVDLDDDDEVDDALDEVAEDIDDDILEDVDEVLAFVDDECDTELVEAAADDTDDPSGNDQDDEQEEEEDPVEVALDALCADDTIDTIQALFDGGALDGDFDDERDALALVSEASDRDLDEQVDLLLDAVDVMEDLDGTGISDDEAADALGQAFLDEFGAEGLGEVTAAGDDVLAFVDGECGTDLSSDPDSPAGTDPGTSDDDSLEEFADLVDSCEDGDMADCDELFLITPVGSEAEDVGRTCGGLGDQTTAGQCEELFG